MLTASSGSVPTWLLVLSPIFSTLLTAALVLAAFYPHFKDRRARQDAEEKRSERLDATADAVLGRDADPTRGRTKIVGLIETVPEVQTHLREIRSTIGHTNGSRKTVMDHLSETSDAVAIVRAAQVELNETVDSHAAEDSAMFAELQHRVDGLHTDVERLKRP